MVTLRRIFSKVADLMALQDNTDRALRDVQGQPPLGGRQIDGIGLSSSGATLVDHGLGREPIGWLVVDIDASATVYRTTAAFPDKHLSLRASAACTVSVYVY